MMRVRVGSREFWQLPGSPPGRGPTAANAFCASLSQLTVYLGKRDFVDHIDLVEPVGESLEAGEVGEAGLA